MIANDFKLVYCDEIRLMIKHTKKNNKKNNENNPENKNHYNIEPDTGKNSHTKLFWVRVCMAAIGGIMATLLFESVEGEERRWASILLLISIFITSIGLAKLLKIQFHKSEKKKIITTGMGSYVFIYLFMWILTYTLSHAKM